MKQVTIGIFTSVLVLANYVTGLMNFLPAITYSFPLMSLMPSGISPVIISAGLMILGVVLDMMIHRSKKGSALVIVILGIAYWMVTPNLLLLALFTGIIVFGQLAMKE